MSVTASLREAHVVPNSAVSSWDTSLLFAEGEPGTAKAAPPTISWFSLTVFTCTTWTRRTDDMQETRAPNNELLEENLAT